VTKINFCYFSVQGRKEIIGTKDGFILIGRFWSKYRIEVLISEKQASKTSFWVPVSFGHLFPLYHLFNALRFVFLSGLFTAYLCKPFPAHRSQHLISQIPPLPDLCRPTHDKNLQSNPQKPYTQFETSSFKNFRKIISEKIQFVLCFGIMSFRREGIL